MQKTRILLFLMILFLFNNSLFSETKEIKIIKEGNLISADIENADIESVMRALSKEFNFNYIIFPEMQNKLVTTKLQRTSLPEGIEKIIQENYLLTFDKSGKISKIFILNRSDQDFIKRSRLIELFINNKFPSQKELRELVTKNVRIEYPNAKLLTTIPHEDIKGNLVSYIFGYYLGSDDMPALERIQKELREEAQRNMVNARKKNDDKNIKNSVMNKSTNQSEKTDFFSYKPVDYMTLEIAASYDSPPVKKFYQGLPMNLIMYPFAEDLLKRKRPNIKTFEFKRTFILSLLGIGFEFEDSSTKKSFYVDVLNKAVFERWEEKPKVNSQEIDQARDAEVKKQWEQFLSF